LAERHISLALTEQAKDHFAGAGYDPNSGARPLKRLLQKEIETNLGRKLLANEVRDHDHVLVDWDGENLTFSSQAVAAAAA
jgi:ATP-dependent Clp protease ATP-binding subunit ClpB